MTKPPPKFGHHNNISRLQTSNRARQIVALLNEMERGHITNETVAALHVHARHCLEDPAIRAATDINRYPLVRHYANWTVHTTLERSQLAFNALRDMAANFREISKRVRSDEEIATLAPGVLEKEQHEFEAIANHGAFRLTSEIFSPQKLRDQMIELFECVIGGRIELFRHTESWSAVLMTTCGLVNNKPMRFAEEVVTSEFTYHTNPPAHGKPNIEKKDRSGRKQLREMIESAPRIENVPVSLSLSYQPEAARLVLYPTDYAWLYQNASGQNMMFFLPPFDPDRWLWNATVGGDAGSRGDLPPDGVIDARLGLRPFPPDFKEP